MSQISLLFGCIVQSIDTIYGFGTTFSSIDRKNLDNVRLVSVLSGFFLILAVAMSKTSFALTFLRFTSGRVRTFIYFVIFTVNAAQVVSATFQWIQCWPIEKLWHQDIEGKCIPLALANGYNMATAGKTVHFLYSPIYLEIWA